MRTILRFRSLITLLLIGVGSISTGQSERPIDLEVVGHVLKPEKLEPTEKNLRHVKLPAGFTLDKWAEGLENPRIIAVADDGAIYVTQFMKGEVVMLRDADNDGKADEPKVIAQIPFVHGIALHNGKMYLASVGEVVVGDINADGTVSKFETLIRDLPPGGQHNKRTIAFGPDEKLYISIGSLADVYPDPSARSNATICRANADGSGFGVFARGLRNTLGFAWHPQTRELWGVDHGIDWLGDNKPPEELNRIVEGANYGYPFVWGDRQPTPELGDPPGTTREEFSRVSTPPVLGFAPHSAPMQIVFYTGTQFPEEFRTSAFVSLHGSWNRKPPSGYEVVRVDFKDGEPKEVEPFLRGFATKIRGSYGYVARPVGLAISKDGALLVGDDSNGIIYKISYGESRDVGSSKSSERNPSTRTSSAKTGILRDFLTKAHIGGRLEVQSCQMAEQKASNPAVRDIAKELVHDHTAATDVVAQIAISKGVELREPMAMQLRYVEQMKDWNEAQFDQKFLGMQIAAHQKAISMFEKASKDIEDPEVQIYIVNMLPTLRTHLDELRKLDPHNGEKSGEQKTDAQ